MFSACRNLLLTAKKIAVLIGKNHCQGYTEIMKNVVGTNIQTF